MGRPYTDALKFVMPAPDEIELNNRLKQIGIQSGILELAGNYTLYPDCVPQLLEFFREPLSIYRRVNLAQAILARKPNAGQKREVIDVLLNLVRENPERGSAFESIMLNELANNISKDKVHELGAIVLDKRYLTIRPAVVQPLYKIGNSDAITYLKQVAMEGGLAAYALDALARLRVEGIAEMCEAALADKDVLFKDAIRETYRKVKRRQEKKSAGTSHITRDPIPNGLAEWSINLDAPELPKALKCIQKSVGRGFGKLESTEVSRTADDLSVNDDVRFKFEIEFMNQSATLWLEIFCDDEDAYDLGAFGLPALISKIEAEMKSCFGD